MTASAPHAPPPSSLARDTAASGVVLALAVVLVLWLLGIVSANLLLPLLIAGAVVLGVAFGVPGLMLARRIRRLGAAPSERVPTTPPAWSPSAPFSVYETPREEDAWKAFIAQRQDPRLLLGFTRDLPASVQATFDLSGAILYRISRAEGEGIISPSDADRLGFLIEQHLSRGPGRIVVLPGVEGLVEAGNLVSVRRLFDLGREKAIEHHGAVLTTLDPASLSPDQRAVLERDAVRLVYT